MGGFGPSPFILRKSVAWHRIGSLEAGKDADIAIFDGNPMEIFTRTLYTIINGEIVCTVMSQGNDRRNILRYSRKSAGSRPCHYYLS